MYVSSGISEDKRLLFAFSVSCQISAVENTEAVDQGTYYGRETHGYVSVGFTALQKDAPFQFVFAATLWADRVAGLAAGLSKSSLCPLLRTPVTERCLSLFLQVYCDRCVRQPVSGLPHFKHHLS